MMKKEFSIIDGKAESGYHVSLMAKAIGCRLEKGNRWWYLCKNDIQILSGGDLKGIEKWLKSEISNYKKIAHTLSDISIESFKQLVIYKDLTDYGKQYNYHRFNDVDRRLNSFSFEPKWALKMPGKIEMDNLEWSGFGMWYITDDDHHIMALMLIQ
ncbi:MAG: hypothetical protein WC284_14745 [Candidimonas sp.]